MGWTAYSSLHPGPAPYRYHLVEVGDVERFATLDLKAWPALKLAKYEVRTEGIDQPLAVAYVARRGDSVPIMLGWENRSGEPLVFADTDVAELKTLAQAIAKYAPQDALLLGWWDTLRALRLLTGRETAFNDHLGEPFMVPGPWQRFDRPIAEYEREFWGAPPDEAESRRFQRFAEALSSEVAAGAAMLRELAGDKEAYVVVHVADLYKLSLLYPERLGVAYKDFPVRSDVHGPISFVKRWISDHKYTALYRT